MRKHVICLLAVLVFMTGCSKKEEIVTEPEDLRPIQSSCIWDNMTIDAITPVTAFESTEDSLLIFPYNNNDTHIKVRLFVVSNNHYWETVKSAYKGTNNIKEGKGYSLVTNEFGVTYGYIERDEETAYLVEADSLPSSYVECTLRALCNAGS